MQEKLVPAGGLQPFTVEVEHAFRRDSGIEKDGGLQRAGGGTGHDLCAGGQREIDGQVIGQPADKKLYHLSGRIAGIIGGQEPQGECT
jgi:hypothetical protein